MKLENILTLKTITIIHDVIIEYSGGAEGIHSKNMILSSLSAPFSSYGSQEFYPTPIEKAGILFYSIIKNHGFVDGNKRTACLALSLVLYIYGYRLTASDLSIEKMALDIARNRVSKEKVFLWIYHNIGFDKDRE